MPGTAPCLAVYQSCMGFQGSLSLPRCRSTAPVSAPSLSSRHSDSREDCRGLPVLRLNRRSNVIHAGLLFPVGVWHSISSRLRWITCPACCSRATICSTLARWALSSLRESNTPTWWGARAGRAEEKSERLKNEFRLVGFSFIYSG